MTVCDDKGTHFHNVELIGSKDINLACHKTSTKMAASLMAGYYNCIDYCHGSMCVLYVCVMATVALLRSL